MIRKIFALFAASRYPACRLCASLAIAILALAACKATNKPVPAPEPSSLASTRPAGPQKPVGIYEVTEIEHDGRVDIRGPANEAVTLTLFPGGSYSRRVDKDGKTYLDQGDYRIEGGDLVLLANIVDKKPVTSVTEWRRPIQVSEDAVELRIGDNKNHWAVFRRTKQLGSEEK